MQDFRPYLKASPLELISEIALVQGDLATCSEELCLARIGYENAYVRGLQEGETVAERERTARGMALPLKVSVIELETRVRVLELSLELLRFLYERQGS